MGMYQTANDHVKITYLHTLHHFALDARIGKSYHGCDIFVETAASPVAVRLHADPAYTTNRELFPNVAGVSTRSRSGAKRITRCATTPVKRGPCA